jgi:hypothetical protein
MAPKATENTPEIYDNAKSLVNKDGSITKEIAWAMQNVASPEEALDLLLQAGLTVLTISEELSGDFKLVHKEEKAEWCAKHIGTPFMFITWNFYPNQSVDENGVRGEFVACHVISRFGKYIINDGTIGGIYGQLRKVTDGREEADPESAVKRTSTAGLMAPRGLRENKPFAYDTREKRAIPRAELNDTVRWPMEYRAMSSPSWKIDQ